MHVPDNHRRRRPDSPNYLRRSYSHDYTLPSRYMITLRAAASTPPLSYIDGDVYVRTGQDAPHTILNYTGTIVERAIEDWKAKYAVINVVNYVIMPDHVHLCLDVCKPLASGLSRAVATLMGTATRIYNKTPFFTKGFNDSIAYNNDQWARQLAYIDNNPRRYLIKQRFPDYLRTRWIIGIGDSEYEAIGNIFLLKRPQIEVVRFSRSFSLNDFDNMIKGWKVAVWNGGVLISPFIHPRENEIRKYAITNGGCYIRICENGFSERGAVHGNEFDLMAEGRVLLIAPMIHDTRKVQISYRFCQNMNATACAIARKAHDGSITVRRR